GSLSARLINRRTRTSITDTGATIDKTTPDQVLVHGTLERGAAFSIHYRGGLSRADSNLLWEINGNEGDIQVTGASGHEQLEQCTIRGARGTETALTALMPPAEAYADWPDSPVARNVARMYALLARDIREGTRLAPGFGDAVALHEALEAIERSAAADTRNAPWASAPVSAGTGGYGRTERDRPYRTKTGSPPPAGPRRTLG